MGNQLAGDDTLIYRTEVDAFLITQNRLNVVAVKNAGKNPHIVQIQLQKILSGRLDQRKNGGGNRLHAQSDTGADQIIKFILIIRKSFAALVFDALGNDTLFLVLQIRGDQIIDAANLQFAAIVIFRRVRRIIRIYL